MAFSCEPKRSSHRYSVDLTRKIINISERSIGIASFCGCKKTLLVNYQKDFHSISGGVQKKQYPAERAALKSLLLSNTLFFNF